MLLVLFAPIFRSRQPAQPLPSAAPVAIRVESVDTVPHPGSIDIIARVRNPNPRAGVAEFVVTFILLDAQGQEVRRIDEQTYLLPGSLNYIAALHVPLTVPITQVKVELPSQPLFSTPPAALATPTFNSFPRELTTRTIGQATIEVQKGVVANTSTAGFRQVDITGVAFDAEGKVIGIGKTFIGQFKVGEQREFTLQWPKPAAGTARVIILPAANIFQADNILRTVGDPSQLR